MLNKLRPRIICPDGFSISVQADASKYCLPRQDNADYYTHVELGFPSSDNISDNLKAYAECHNDYTNTIYGYVPVELCIEELKRHGLVIQCKQLQGEI